MNLRVEAEVWQQAWMQLRYSFRSVHAPEFGVLGLVVPSLHPKRSALIINGLIMPDERSFDVQERDRLTFSTNYLRRAVLEARRCGAGIVVLHTHPEARDWVDFSPFDNLEEPQLVASLRDLLPGQWFASVVGGSQSFMGRVWAPKSTGWSQLDRLTVVGEPWNEFNLDGQPPTSVPSPGAMFDRALAVTGIGALGRLQRMRVAVVGTSGTGSLMAELLVRAGVGELLLVDDDRMGGENLNRILSSRRADADNRRLKVEVLKERLDDLKLGTHIETIARSVAEPKVLDELRGVDVVFGCMDRHWPRYLLSRLAIQYVLPLIDMGTEIGVTGDRLDSVNARVSYVAPGRPCLSCSGVVLSDRIQLETLTPQEQSAHLTMGYSPDFRLHEPAVTDLNMRAAGLAMLLLRHLLQPFMQEGVPVHLRESVVTASVKRDNADISARCVFCDSGIYRGTGDRGPAILL